jgi:transcriptional regulator with XRE-family HTH domain
MELLRALRAAIKASGLSGYELCNRSGVNKAAMSRFMSGERGVSVESAEALAKAMGLEIVLGPVRKGKGKATTTKRGK